MARKSGKSITSSRSKTLVLTRAARQDLAQIHFWIRGHEDLESADSVTDMILNAAKKLARIGHSGRPRDDLQIGLRGVSHKGFSLFFVIRDGEMRVIHIVRGTRDVRKLDFTDTD
ncbi:MAG: type II toxin-antitoxin system RelE/ParE family toxin [Hyphomicrobiaceae bacterium]